VLGGLVVFLCLHLDLLLLHARIATSTPGDSQASLSPMRSCD
jgi:hypothetical protein